MMNQQFGQLVQSRTVPGQVAVFAPHAAVQAVFAAVIGNLNHAAQENLMPKSFPDNACSALMESLLGSAVRCQDTAVWEKRLLSHRFS